MVSLFSRLAFSLATANNNQLQRAAVLRVSLDPFLPLPRTSSSPTFPSVVPYTCGRAYLACIRVYTCVCAPARSPLSHPSFLLPLSRDMYGFTQTLRWSCTNFFLPPIFTFSMHLSISSLLAFFFSPLLLS